MELENLSAENRKEAEDLQKEVAALGDAPKKRWSVVRQYAADQTVEVDADSAEQALELANSQFGYLQMMESGPLVEDWNIDNVGTSVYDNLITEHPAGGAPEPVLETD